MNTIPIAGVDLTTSDVAAIARRRAEGVPWTQLLEELEVPAEFHPDIELLPLFHPDWAKAYAEANRQCERDTFAETQLVTRQLMRYAANPKARTAARKRAGTRRPRSRAASGDAPLAALPGSALAFRLARGETFESIGAAYLAGLTGRHARARPVAVAKSRRSNDTKPR